MLESATATCHSFALLATLHAGFFFMSQTPDSARALQRRKRQAEALKANLKRRKEAAAAEKPDDPAQASHENSDG